MPAFLPPSRSLTPPITGGTVHTKVFQSTHLHSAIYDSQAKRLTVKFASGRTYTSSPRIPILNEVWENLRKSGSPGQYFDQVIKPHWKGIEVHSK